jgi:hypothetical protein
MIIALAGRRIDASGAETTRFPSESIALVASATRVIQKKRSESLG